MISVTHTNSLAQAAARLGPNHGYRIEGDIALLHAEVALAERSSAQWALQLWACEQPFDGGTLQGVKVAEAALTDDGVQTQHLAAEALASVPGGQRDYSMVLVLASGANGAFDQIHDFANYPARERFITPHLEGSVGYQVEGAEVALRAGGVRNPRRADNLSGSLALELWALPEEYRGGPVFGGTLLASADVGRISGESAVQGFERRVKFEAPRTGRWNVVLMLREWVPGGYVTRDFCTFAEQYVVEAKAETDQKVAAEQKAVPVELEAAPELEAAASKLEAAATELKAAELDLRAAAIDFEAEEAEKPAPEVKTALRAVAAPTPVANANGVPAALASAAAKPEVVVPPAEAQPAAAVAVAPNADGRISITTASVEEIAQLKGLTRKVAVEIVKGRPYASIDELTRVRGIGPKLLAKLRGQISL